MKASCKHFARNSMKKPTEDSTKIEVLRYFLRMDIDQLAKELGLTRFAVWSYETRTRRPRIEIAFKIIDIAEKNGFPMTLEDIYPRPNEEIKTD